MIIIISVIWSINVIIPDDDDFTHIKFHIVNLGYEYGSDSLIECCSIHGHDGTDRHHEASHPFVHAQIILQAVEADG